MRNRYIYFVAETTGAPYNLEVFFPADSVKYRLSRMMAFETDFQVGTEVEAYVRFNENVQGADPEIKSEPFDTHDDINVKTRLIKDGESNYHFEVGHEGRLYVSNTFGTDFVRKILKEKLDFAVSCAEKRMEYYNFELVVEQVENYEEAYDIIRRFFDEGNDLPKDRKDQAISYGPYTLRLRDHTHIDVDDTHDFELND